MVKKVKENLEKNNGYILLKGVGLMRSVSLYDTMLSVEKSRKVAKYADSFNWAYDGDCPKQLALAILLELLSKKDAVEYCSLFKATIVAILPPDNFDVRVNFKKWLSVITDPNPAELIHPNSLIDFKAEKSYFSLWLHFVSGKFKSAEFEAGTLEYSLLKELSPSEFLELKNWCYKTSAHTGQNGLKVHMILQYNEVENTYTVLNGLGIGVYTGQKLK